MENINRCLNIFVMNTYSMKIYISILTANVMPIMLELLFQWVTTLFLEAAHIYTVWMNLSYLTHLI